VPSSRLQMAIFLALPPGGIGGGFECVQVWRPVHRGRWKELARQKAFHAFAHIVGQIFDFLVRADHTWRDHDQQFCAARVFGARAKQIAHNGNVAQERNARATHGAVVADQAAQYDGFARAHRHFAADLTLQETALTGGRVNAAHIGDRLVELHGHHVAGVDRGGDAKVDARVFVLDVAGNITPGGDGLARLHGLLRTHGNAGGVVVHDHE
jgi:hypothetical protein